MIHDGKGLASYGFDNKTNLFTENEDFNRRWKFIKQEAGPEALEVLLPVSLRAPVPGAS